MCIREQLYNITKTHREERFLSLFSIINYTDNNAFSEKTDKEKITIIISFHYIYCIALFNLYTIAI